jgi:lysophospholipase L1-like esterase
MEWYEPEIRFLEARTASAALPQGVVAFYGSSSIRLWDSLDRDFSDLPVWNLGFGGSTLAACAHFYPRVLEGMNPRSVLLYAGDNDLGDGQSPVEVRNSYERLAAQHAAKHPGVPLIFLSIKFSLARWHLRDRITEANAEVAERVRVHASAGLPFHFVDVASTLLQPNGDPNRECFAPDGLHLSPAGYARWRAALDEHRTLFT